MSLLGNLLFCFSTQNGRKVYLELVADSLLRPSWSAGLTGLTGLTEMENEESQLQEFPFNQTAIPSYD